MSDQPARPAGAIALAKKLFPGARSLTWKRLSRGGLHPLWRVTATVGRSTTSAVIKQSGETGRDPDSVDREARAYAEVLPFLTIRVPGLLGSIVESGTCYLGLEDLATEYRFPNRLHQWSPQEVACFLPTYARLHVEGLSLPDRPWMLSYERPTWSPDLVASRAAELAGQGIWGDLIGLEALAERALAGLPALAGLDTVLHLDVHPPNVGLRLEQPCNAALIDWDMTGWGAPEFDLAYLDLQPFESARGLERRLMLDWYWNERSRLAGWELSQNDRRDRQRLADTVFALALIPVAHRSIVEPYPPGSQPGSYWDAMRPVLFRRLRMLCRQ